MYLQSRIYLLKVCYAETATFCQHELPRFVIDIKRYVISTLRVVIVITRCNTCNLSKSTSPLVIKSLSSQAHLNNDS